MNLRKNWKLNLALLALALGFASLPAAAAQVFSGTFALPTEAYWGDTLLQPGEYSFALDMTPARTPIVHIRGEGVNASLIAIPTSVEPKSERSFLTLESLNGTYAVRELTTGTVGRSYDFVVSKAAKAGIERGVAMNVPVSTGAGR